MRTTIFIIMRNFIKSPNAIINLKIIQYSSLLLSVILAISCKNSQGKKPDHIYFGGEIINPNSDFVTLYNRSGIQDTIYLDENNRFLKKYDSLPDGLYRFFHQPESQMILLERGDSILVRVNTVEFDESLVYSGRGSRKNNFVMDMFLENEKDIKQNGNQKFKLLPKDFMTMQDSLKNRRSIKFDKLKKKIKPSALANKIMKGSFEYHFFTDNEAYTARYFGSNLINAKDKFKNLPPSFFDYRKNINLNDSELKLSYDYHRFLMRYIENTSYMNFAEKNNYKQEEPNATLSKLDLIDTTFTVDYIKNVQLSGITRQFIDFNEDSITSKKVLDRFLQINTDPKRAKTMETVVQHTTKLVPGNRIPDQKLIASDSTMISLKALTNKSTLSAVYFWSVLDIQYYKRAHTKVAKLREQFPNIQFISINIDEDKTKKWINILDKYEYLRDFEYQFDDAGKSRNELVLYQFTRDKTILLGRNGKILNPNADIFDDQFENELRIYMQQHDDDVKFLK